MCSLKKWQSAGADTLQAKVTLNTGMVKLSGFRLLTLIDWIAFSLRRPLQKSARRAWQTLRQCYIQLAQSSCHVTRVSARAP